MRTITKRATILFICILAMLSLFSTVAFAGWDASFGGGGAGGTIGTGFWNEERQGIRITILTPSGEPAFFFGDGRPPVNYLDILYTDNGTTAIDYMLSSCKAEQAIRGTTMTEYPKADTNRGNLVYIHDNVRKEVMGAGNNDARIWTKACILSFNWYRNWTSRGSNGDNGRRWAFLTPKDGSDVAIRKNFDNIAGTYPIKDIGSGNWQKNGEKIGKWLYSNDPGATKPDDGAAIHFLFNIYQVTSDNRTSNPIWHLTEAGKQAVGAAIAQAYDPDGTPDSSGQIYKTVQDRIDAGQHVYRTTELMEIGNMAIVVEPIIWAELVNWGGQRSGCMIYGTPTNVADAIRANVAAGNWNSYGWQYGGWDVDLHRDSRSCFVLSKDIEYGGVNFLAPADGTSSKPNTHDPRINQKDLGYAMHIYICGSDDGTHTWDNNQYPDSSKFIEHPAPDPAVDPPTAGKYPSDKPSCIYRIVKVYDKEVLKEGEGKSIEHVATYVRENTYSKIEIQDEIEAGG